MVMSDSQYADARSTALMLLSDMVPNVEDRTILADIAIMSPYQDCRAAAIERLVGHSSALLEVANKGKYKDSRDSALEKLKGDTGALKSVSRLSNYKDTRKKAHKMVSDPEVFHAELSKILG
jgi:adenylylsulfate kinase-like enzyme